MQNWWPPDLSGETSYVCAQPYPPLLRGFIFPPPHRSFEHSQTHHMSHWYFFSFFFIFFFIFFHFFSFFFHFFSFFSFFFIFFYHEHRAGVFPMQMGCVWCIEKTAPAFSDQTIPHTSPIYIKSESTIYITPTLFPLTCGSSFSVTFLRMIRRRFFVLPYLNRSKINNR